MSEKQFFGYNGKIARIDLTSGNITIEEPAEDYYQRYIGGRGFIVTTLLKELSAGADPLGPENRLIFALGPLTGLPMPGSGRNSIGVAKVASTATGTPASRAALPTASRSTSLSVGLTGVSR